MPESGQTNIIFEITERCNHNCVYCYNVWRADASYPDTEMSAEGAKVLLSRIVDETRCENLTISGGEPCLRKDLESLIAFIRPKVKNVILLTNGSLLDKNRIRSLIDSGVGLFEISLTAADAGLFREMAGADTFSRVIDSIISVKELGGYVVAVFVATKKNLHALKDTVELLTALGVDGIMFNRVNIGGNGIKNAEELMPSLEELNNALAFLDEHSGMAGIGISCSIPMQPCVFEMSKYPRLNKGFCLGGRGKDCYYTFDPVGNVRICNHSNYIIGNIRDTSFKDIVNNPYVAEFPKIKPAFCSDCIASDTCQGGCKASSEVCYGDLYAEEPFFNSIPVSQRKKRTRLTEL